MNHVEIKYSYLQQKAEVTMDGEKASPYSELASILGRPFLDSAAQIIQGLDNEIYDDYVVDLYATEFQYKLLRHLAQKSEYCQGIRFHEIESLYPKAELVKRVEKICVQHGISAEHGATLKVYFSSSNSIKFPSAAFVHTDTPSADIGIFENGEPISSTVRVPIYLSDNFAIGRQNGRVVYCIPNDALPLFWEFCLLEFVERPVISECLTALRYANLSPIETVELNALKANEPAYYIGAVPAAIDQGDTSPVEFFSFPDHLYTLCVENSKIVSLQGQTISANSPGTTNIFVHKNGDEIAATIPICVIGHQYVQEIRLIPRFEYLKRNQKGQIDVVVTPMNAEDANKLVWKVSNPAVLQIDDAGRITALENGSATVTVSGHHATASIDIEVKPTLQSIRFPQQSICIKTGDTVILECDVVPADAPTENFSWDLDNGTIATINPSKYGHRCQVIASPNYEGKGNIRCYDPESKLGAICNIEVVSKTKATTAGKIALSCWMAGIMIPAILPISTIASLYGLACDSEPAHKKRYIVCAIGSVLTLLFWLMAGGI